MEREKPESLQHGTRNAGIFKTRNEKSRNLYNTEREMPEYLKHGMKIARILKIIISLLVSNQLMQNNDNN